MTIHCPYYLLPRLSDSKCGAGSSVTSSLSPPPSSSSRNVSSAKIGGKRKERDTTASSHTAKSPHQTSSDDKGAPKPKVSRCYCNLVILSVFS